MPSNTKFPHNPYGLSSSYSRSDVLIDGMKVKFDKVADLVPAELTVKGGQAHSGAQSVRAMTALVFDPSQVFEVSYTSPGNETLAMVVARNYHGMATEEIAKAIAYHQERLQLGDTLLKPGQVINVYHMPSTDPVIVRPPEPLTDDKLEAMIKSVYEGWYEANMAAIGGIKNILWWPESDDVPTNTIFNDSIWGIFKGLVAYAKDLLGNPKKYLLELAVGIIETDLKKFIFGIYVRQPSKSGNEAFEFVQDYEFSMRAFFNQIPDLAKAFRIKYRVEYDRLESKGINPDQLALETRTILESMDRIFRNSFTYEVELLARLFSSVYKTAYFSVELNGSPGSRDLSYAGVRGVPEKNRVLLNREYNRLADKLGWKYMSFYQMGIPFQVHLLYPKGALKCNQAMHLLAEQYPMEGYLRTQAQDIPRVLHFHDTKLYKMEGKHGTPLNYRLPYPVRFSVS